MGSERSRNTRVRGLAGALFSLVMAFASSAAADPSPADKAKAYELYQQARDAYAKGQFEESATLIRSAQAIDPNPILTYNLARALEGSGRLDEAIRAYTQYLEERPDATDRGFVEGRIGLLSKQMRERADLEQKLEQARSTAVDPVARAAGLNREATQALRAGRLEEAVRLLRASYAVHPEASVLYDLGRALEGLGRRAEAEQVYRAFLEAVPTALEREDVLSRLSRLTRPERRSAVESVDPGGAERAVAPASRGESRGPAVGPIVVVSVGAAALAAGVVLSVLAVDKHDSWRMAESQAEAASVLSEADDLALAGNIAMASGAALALTGGVWWLVEALGGDAGSVVVGPSPVGPGARVSVRF